MAVTSIQKRIDDALAEICSNIEQDVYEGSTPFIVYEITSEKGALFSDDNALIVQVDVSIDYVVHRNTNYNSKKKAIKKALVNAGFDYPSVAIEYNATQEVRRIIFETSINIESEE